MQIVRLIFLLNATMLIGYAGKDNVSQIDLIPSSLIRVYYKFSSTGPCTEVLTFVATDRGRYCGHSTIADPNTVRRYTMNFWNKASY